MSAPLPFVPPGDQFVGDIPFSQNDQDRIEQIWHDQQRLVAIEHAYMTGDTEDVHAIMAGVDPVESRTSVDYLYALMARMRVSRLGDHSVRAS